ncbi:MAG TPA: LCP family protein [Solirubrobacterales bacterium]|nr:LCP family protein [Solirubrobacterales bacterium]
MPDEERPKPPPDYKVYRSRRMPSVGKPDLKSLRDKVKPGGQKKPPDGDQRPVLEPEKKKRPWLKWIGLAVGGWLLLSFVTFAISATIQKSKLADTGDALGGNPLMAVFPQNILVLGTDVRAEGFGADAESDECIEQASSGATPSACSAGARADTLMVLRAGGGAFEKLSIPRDTLAAIPGVGNDKINSAYAFGGAELQIETVEDFLGIDINHVAIVDFAGFEDLIDSVGGVKVDLDRQVCNSISDGAFKIDLGPGEVTLSGDKALALARTRTSSCGAPLTDLDRTRFQQLILQGLKDRLTDPLRIPYNFIKGPLIGWSAPKAFVSDMGALTMPQFVFAAAIGGSSDSAVLKPVDIGANPLVVPVEECIKAVRKLTGDAPENDPLCSPVG